MADETIMAWRIVRPKYVESAFDGEGARLYGGRWNSRGVAVVYTSGSLALAALEMLVHLEDDALLDDYLCMPVTFPRHRSEARNVGELPDDWRDEPAPASTRDLGDAWLKGLDSLALRVPSVVIPEESNYLLNIAHSEWEHVEIGEARPFRYDARLAR